MKAIILWSALFIQFALYGQLNGIIYGSDNHKKEPLVGAKIKIQNKNIGVISDEEGKFELVLPKDLPDTLIFSAIGYYPDTVIVTKSDRFIAMEIVLYSEILLPEVVASYRKDSHSISRLKTLHVEQIDAKELRKAACCNLSESFETNASVDVNITDAVSGAKKIQMMGLDGVYTQLQFENIPTMRGLESSYGLNTIPGTWVESIQITKGTGNVVNGYESMAGLVNFELKKPHTIEAFYVNAYVNRFGRSELNFNGGGKVSSKWETAWFAHASGMFSEMDNNDDGFRDIPIGSNLTAMNRWKYSGDKMEAQFGLSFYNDDKSGGQLNRFSEGAGIRYDVSTLSRNYSAFAKTGFFTSKPFRSFGVVYNYKHQDLEANFGSRQFIGQEDRLYINSIYDDIIGTTDHKLKTGLSGVFIALEQQVGGLNDDRIEIVPGAFAEYTYTGSRLTAVLGARYDYHNLFAGQFSPRVHAKYALSENLDLRVTGGKGWRTPNYIIDNISLLASSKTWVSAGDVQQEISWNTGASLVQNFKMGKRNGSVVLDYYYTYFINQLVVDRDQSSDLIAFSYLSGTSFSNAFQVETSLPLGKTFDLRFAYKYLDVRSQFGGELQPAVFIPKHRGFVNFAYLSRNKRWEADLTASVFGESRLPNSLLPDGTVLTNNSDIFPMVNAQITHVYKKLDIYLGAENLTNFKQSNPIIDAANPFGSYFDATRIWGPIMGANVYLGIRYSIKQKTEDKK